MNTLITGVAGSGKTTMASELSKRGYHSLNMDAVEGLSAWVDLSTGEPDPNFKRNSAEDWAGKYDWLWDEQRLKELVEGANNTYFCGGSGNQDKFYSFFDKVFLLEMDEELIRDRIFNHVRDHTYGQMPGEIEEILGYFEDFQDGARKYGAVVIDARKPVREIADIILAETIGK